MTNIQPIEKSIDSDVLEVHSIYQTIQGEGPFAGCPAIFVRMAGCSLMCPACDTDYTSKRQKFTVDQLVHKVTGDLCASPISLVVLTGGEPLRQYGIWDFVNEVIRENRRLNVQIETNGLHAPNFEALDFFGGTQVAIVCSPKTSCINDDLIELIDSGEKDCYKYILNSTDIDPDDGLPTHSLGMKGKPYRPPENFPRERIFVQPLDCDEPETSQGMWGHKTYANVKAAMNSCLKYGYRLSLQQHKLLGLD